MTAEAQRLEESCAPTGCFRTSSTNAHERLCGSGVMRPSGFRPFSEGFPKR